MNPLGTRARSAELARLLEGSGAMTATVAGPHAAVAGRLRTAGIEINAGVAPRAEFRAALRTRLVAVASVQAAAGGAAGTATPTRGRTLDSAVSWSQSRRAQRGIGLAAGAMASVVALAGIAVAGSQSLPGDPFYSVKRGGEALELHTAAGNVAKGSKHLQFAAERLREVRELSLGRDAAFSGSPEHPLAAGALGGSVSKRARSALADMDRETRIGSDLLTSAYRDTNSDAPLEILSRFAGRQTRDLQALLPDLPAATRLRAETSLALVSGVAVDASQLLAVGVCTGLCAPSQAAPALPPPSGGPVPQPAPRATTDAPCGCQPAPDPARTPAATPAVTPPNGGAEPTTSPSSAASSPSPTPAPQRSSSSQQPIPLPSTPVPLLTALPTAPPTILPTPLRLPDLPSAVGAIGSALPLP